jgi:hypothetical protein
VDSPSTSFPLAIFIIAIEEAEPSFTLESSRFLDFVGHIMVSP